MIWTKVDSIFINCETGLDRTNIENSDKRNGQHRKQGWRENIGRSLFEKGKER